MKLLTEGCECQLEQAIEAALLGLASLALTLANILCIVLTGIAILRQALAHFTYLLKNSFKLKRKISNNLHLCQIISQYVCKILNLDVTNYIFHSDVYETIGCCLLASWQNYV